MIVATVGLLMRREVNHTEHILLTHFCYDAESLNQAKQDFLATDKVLEYLNDGWSLQVLHAHAADINQVIVACSGAAEATMRALMELTKTAAPNADAA